MGRCGERMIPPWCGYRFASGMKSRMLKVNIQRPCAVAPSNCSSSRASRDIHSFGVRVTSWPRLSNARYSEIFDVSASRWRLGLATACFQVLLGLDIGVNFEAVRLVQNLRLAHT